MKLSPRQFRNAHGEGAVKLMTPVVTKEMTEFCTQTVSGDWTVATTPPRTGLPAIWRFATMPCAIAFRLRFSEARKL